MSSFDPQAFLSATIDQPLEKAPPLPEGDYTALVGKPEIRVNQGKKDPSKTYTFLDIPLQLEVPAELQAQGIPPTRTIRDSVILDVSPSGGLDIAPGKNGGLRRYREALDMNRPGEAFSIGAMEGRPVKAKVKHELYNDQIQERIGGVAKL